jgi:ferric-dicitrate binding protein FerR (iron transport regulator)
MASPKEAAKKLKEVLSAAPRVTALSTAPKVTVKDGKVEVETADGERQEASEIQKHKFAG